MSAAEEDFDRICLVCSKVLEHGGGFARLNVEERMIALCCPLCLEVYQKTPERFLAKLALFKSRPPGTTDGGFDP